MSPPCGTAGCSHVPDDTLCVPPRPCEVGRCDVDLGCQYDSSGCTDAGANECSVNADCEDFNPCTSNVCVTGATPRFCYFPSMGPCDASTVAIDGGIAIDESR